MEALASIDLFNLDDTAFAPAHGIDGMHAKPAIANEPRNYLLGHSCPPPPERGGCLDYFWLWSCDFPVTASCSRGHELARNYY